MKYPHMFTVMDKDFKTSIRTVVIIAQSDFSLSNPWWLDEDAEEIDLVHDLTLEPTIDVEESRHVFNTQKEAWEFIRDWWKTNPDII